MMAMKENLFANIYQRFFLIILHKIFNNIVSNFSFE